MSEIVECTDGLSFEDIIRLIGKKDNGNFYLQVTVNANQWIRLEGGGQEWRFGINGDGNFSVDNNVPPWTTTFEV